MVVNFINLLLGLKYFWNKPIAFGYLEDQSTHFDKLSTLKNPYRYEDLVLNFDEANLRSTQKYQPIYDVLLKKVESVLGLTYY